MGFPANVMSISGVAYENKITIQMVLHSIFPLSDHGYALCFCTKLFPQKTYFPKYFFQQKLTSKEAEQSVKVGGPFILEAMLPLPTLGLKTGNLSQIMQHIVCII